jgi:phosphoribosylformylglycinamidine synthase
VIKAVNTGKVTSSHDVSLGGLGVALAEMCPCIGANVDLSKACDGLRADDALFSESYVRAILSTSEPESLKEALKGVPYTIIGTVGGNCLRIQLADKSIEISLSEMEMARSSLTRQMME